MIAGAGACLHPRTVGDEAPGSKSALEARVAYLETRIIEDGGSKIDSANRTERINDRLKDFHKKTVNLFLQSVPGVRMRLI